jgi:hypothetical protein
MDEIISSLPKSSHPADLPENAIKNDRQESEVFSEAVQPLRIHPFFIQNPGRNEQQNTDQQMFARR